ncbi:MAG: ABC transporter permease [Chitinophagaceae bacterium]|nr:ABC transporter permease [Chitinophagaceae bacterium]
MRTLKFLLQKEFRQIFRDPSILRIIFVVPIIQLLVLPWAADYEIKNLKLSIIDHDRSTYSRQLISKITSTNYFLLEEYSDSFHDSEEEMEGGKVDIALEIPADFERDLVRDNEAPVFLAVNAVNGVKAGLGSAYLQSIIRDFNSEVRAKWIQMPRFSPELNIEVVTANWFNPSMNYKFFMVPGILAVLLTMVGASLSALNIVKEKEIGTIEQINVTPIRKHHFILGKLIPFWVLGLVILTIGLAIAWLAYGIVPLGSMLVIYAFSALYLLAVLGLGLLISTITHNQQQAMLISFFLIMVFVLLGGLYTSIDSMPGWARAITHFNPVAYFVEVIRMVVLKGSGFADIAPYMLIMFVFAITLNGWAIYSYKKRS